MGRRSRQRERTAPSPDAGQSFQAPTSTYSELDAGELELRGVLSPATRAEYASVLAGGLHREDAWQRAAELLFERLAVSWTIHGLRLSRQKELLARYRAATPDERRFVRDSLRRHLHENFPEMQAP